MQELPSYKCHKVVQAFKIVGFEKLPHGLRVSGDSGNGLVVTEEQFVRVKKAAESDADAGPDTLGYLVIYEDGYVSYSPSKAFEEGYTLIDGKTEAPLSWPRFMGGFCVPDPCVASDLDGVLWFIDGRIGRYRKALPFEPTPADDIHGIGWAVKQMHNGSKVRRSWWEKHELAKIGGAMAGFVNEADKNYLMSSEDILAIDWELAGCASAGL